MANTPPTIRPTIPADIPALRSVIDSTELFPGAMLDDMIAPFFKQAEGQAGWLTVEYDQPVAIAYYDAEKMTEGTWNLYLIAVDNAHQGEGIGAALMEHIEDLLLKAQQRLLIVETSDLPEFELTRAFYRKIGYTEEARIREFYKEGEGKVVFWKKLQ